MNINYLAILAIVVLNSVSVAAQELRYFEFTGIFSVPPEDWRDSSFIAATSDPDIIDLVLEELELPLTLRQRHIYGSIASGHGGHNHNADHWFLWHFVPNEWIIQLQSVEVCDGTPYFVDQDTSFWLELGYFCPWGYVPSREVYLTKIDDRNILDDILIGPVPFSNKLVVHSEQSNDFRITLFDSMGRKLSSYGDKSTYHLSLSHLAAGNYWLKVTRGSVYKIIPVMKN